MSDLIIDGWTFTPEWHPEFKVHSCYCGRFDYQYVIYDEELIYGNCFGCKFLSESEDLNESKTGKTAKTAKIKKKID